VHSPITTAEHPPMVTFHDVQNAPDVKAARSRDSAFTRVIGAAG
jgi:hypothetical protein